MESSKTYRGFNCVKHPHYPPNKNVDDILLLESSVNYDDSYCNPVSSFLWVGANHHLNKEEVSKLIEIMQYWLDHGKLPLI